MQLPPTNGERWSDGQRLSTSSLLLTSLFSIKKLPWYVPMECQRNSCPGPGLVEAWNLSSGPYHADCIPDPLGTETN